MAQPPYCPITPSPNTYIITDFPGGTTGGAFSLSGSGAIVGGEAVSIIPSPDPETVLRSLWNPGDPTIVAPVVINLVYKMFYSDLTGLNAMLVLVLGFGGDPPILYVRPDLIEFTGAGTGGASSVSITPLGSGVQCELRIKVFPTYYEAWYNGLLVNTRTLSDASGWFLVEVVIGLSSIYPPYESRLDEVWVVAGSGLPNTCAGVAPVAGGRFGGCCCGF